MKKFIGYRFVKTVAVMVVTAFLFADISWAAGGFYPGNLRRPSLKSSLARLETASEETADSIQENRWRLGKVFSRISSWFIPAKGKSLLIITLLFLHLFIALPFIKVSSSYASGVNLELKDGKFHWGERAFTVVPGVNWRLPPDYGIAFGALAWYPNGNGVTKHIEEIEAEFARLEATGIRVVRVMLLFDGRQMFNKDGEVIGYDEIFKEDVRVFLDLAAETGIAVEFTLLDYLMAGESEEVNGVWLGGRANVITDPIMRQAFVDDFLIPFLVDFGNHPALKIIDLGNEFEWLIRPNENGGWYAGEGIPAPVPLADVLEFFKLVSTTIRAQSPHLLITGGFNSISHPHLLKALRLTRGIDIDYFGGHFYPNMGDMQFLINNLERFIGTKPVSIEEFPTKDTDIVSVIDALIKSTLVKVRGGYLWGIGTDDRHTSSVEVLGEQLERLRVYIEDNNGLFEDSGGTGNQPPVLERIEDIVVRAGDRITINLSASDPEGDELTISYSGFMTENSYTTTADDIGKWIVTVTVSDGNLEVSQDVRITVVSRDENLPPVLERIEDIVVKAGDRITITPAVSDPEGDNLTITYSGFMLENSYTTTADDIGEWTVTVTVSDGNLEVSQDVRITVVSRDEPEQPGQPQPAVLEIKGNGFYLNNKLLILTETQREPLEPGYAFGMQPWEVNEGEVDNIGVVKNIEAVEEWFRELKNIGFSSVEVGLLYGGDRVFGTGKFVYNERFRNDVRAFLDMARQYNILVKFVVFDDAAAADFDLIGGELVQGVRGIFTDAVFRRQFMEDFFEPFLNEFKEHPAFRIIVPGRNLLKIISPKEGGQWSKEGGIENPIALADVRAYLDDIIKAIRDNASDMLIEGELELFYLVRMRDRVDYFTVKWDPSAETLDALSVRVAEQTDKPFVIKYDLSEVTVSVFQSMIEELGIAGSNFQWSSGAQFEEQLNEFKEYIKLNPELSMRVPVLSNLFLLPFLLGLAAYKKLHREELDRSI